MTRGEFSVRARRVQRSSTASPVSEHATSALVPAVGGSASDLAARQAELVAALVAGAPDPAGFDADRLAVARRALLRKRAGEVAAVWPLLAASFGADWPAIFTAYAATRAPAGALRDGWDLARELRGRGTLGHAAVVELAEREGAWRYDGRGDPRRRCGPAVRWTGGLVVLQLAGRIAHLGG